MWAWWPSWPCDHDHLALIGQVVSETKMFENNGHLHVYSPGIGADSPRAHFFFFFFQNEIFLLIWSFAAIYPISLL